MIKKTIRTSLSRQRWIVIMGFIPVILLGFISYYSTEESLVSISSGHLQSVNNEKKQALRKLFEQHRLNLKNVKKETAVVHNRAKKSVQDVQKLKMKRIQEHFNSEAHKLILLSDEILLKNIFQVIEQQQKIFSSVHKKMLQKMAKDMMLKDIYLLNKEGRIVVTANATKRVGQHVTAYSWLLNAAWKKVQKLQGKGSQNVVFADCIFRWDARKNKIFALTPLGGLPGYVVIELNDKVLNDILHDRKGMGDTMESFIVSRIGDNTVLRSDLAIKVGKMGDVKDSIQIQKGLDGLSGVGVKQKGADDIELNAYDPIKLPGVDWTLQTTINLEESIIAKNHHEEIYHTFVQEHGYDDLYLIAPDGHIFYSVNHDAEYNTNILNGPYSKTNLSDLVIHTMQTKKPGFVDYALYRDVPAAFMTEPLLDENGDVELIIAMKLPIGPVNEIMTKRQDMKRSGESYLVGQDHLMRSDSFLDKKHRSVQASFTNSSQGRVENEIVDKALLGVENEKVTKDYRGVDVLASYMPFYVEGVRWALITQMDIEEIEEPLESLKYRTALSVFVMMGVSYILLSLVARERKKHERELRHLAYHDALTGLPNRLHMANQLEQALKRLPRHSSKVAVLYIDLDRFKYINDSFGHPVGDEVLKRVSERIQSVLRNEDMVSRIGGDEFVVLTENLHEGEHAGHLADKIIKVLSPVIEDKQGRRFHVGCSIGISIAPDDSTNKDQLVKYADSAMFMAKDGGRNTYAFYQEHMTNTALEQITMTAALRQAIDEQEFILFYQPQLSLKSNKVVGVEALVRWKHPKMGLISPERFLPVAEEAGMILDLGTLIFEESCRSFRRWKDAGYDLQYIAVNFSSQQLQCLECGDKIKQIMDECGFEHGWLELEITETTLINNLEQTVKNMEGLRDMGIKIAIDDFGTGYSSMAYLKSLPVSTLKVDRSFIENIQNDPSDLAIVQAILAMSKSMGYTVVAEGIETEKQFEILINEKCDIVQGYYFARPMPEDALLNFLDGFNS